MFTNRVWAFYTAYKHNYEEQHKREAVGIISGGATYDVGVTIWIVDRESHFRFNMIKKLLGIWVKDAKASQEPDRFHILNSMKDAPPTTHDKYTATNDALKVIFASFTTTLQETAKDDDKVWDDFITGIIKSEQDIETIVFNFNNEQTVLTTDQSTQLIIHFPLDIWLLEIDNTNFGQKFMEELIQHVDESKNMKMVYLDRTS